MKKVPAGPSTALSARDLVWRAANKFTCEAAAFVIVARATSRVLSNCYFGHSTDKPRQHPAKKMAAFL